MLTINENFLKLPGGYLFVEIARRVNAYKKANPDKKVISLGIGDVTRPLPKVVIDAMYKAVDEMSCEKTMRGYAPDRGYDFLLEAIWENDFSDKGLPIEMDEIFVSDGAKSDTGNFGDILGIENKIAVTDPVYPVYVDTNVMAGRSGVLKDGRWSDIEYLPCTAENDFIPALPKEKPDVIYLCYPNNPTGTTLTKTQLKVWVDYALANNALILFDAAYEAYIQDEQIPHSIFEIDGARKCAVEFRSFSKTAGFTGLRCAYTVVPKDIVVQNKSNVLLNSLWARRQGTKFNGVPYVVQRAAEAVYSPEGKKQIREVIDYYMDNARIIREGLGNAGFKCYGGVNAPYIWLKAPDGINSWTMFDKLLNDLQIVSTPGSGFGYAGEGYIRLTAFGNKEQTMEAVERIVRN